MIFLILLGLTALFLAIVSGFFSVWGLASTFHGVFWSVILMGTALECGKLIGVSFLYRYWTNTHTILKICLILGILDLMCITGLGHYGYLSTGYQSDSIPVKQTEQQIVLLESEKSRLIDRKSQIDNQIASLPSNVSRGRLALIKGFKDEQSQITTKISSLETNELDLKTKLIQTEAHIGPILYIAKAMNLNADDATKYLIYLIILVFDPMALILTLAFNIVIKQRKPTVTIISNIIPNSDNNITKIETNHINVDIPHTLELVPINEKVIDEEPIEPKHILELEPIEENLDDESNIELDVERNIDNTNTLSQTQSVREYRTELEHMINNLHYYQAKLDHGETLTQDENWKYLSIRDSLQKQGFNIYV